MIILPLSTFVTRISGIWGPKNKNVSCGKLRNLKLMQRKCMKTMLLMCYCQFNNDIFSKNSFYCGVSGEETQMLWRLTYKIKATFFPDIYNPSLFQLPTTNTSEPYYDLFLFHCITTQYR